MDRILFRRRALALSVVMAVETDSGYKTTFSELEMYATFWVTVDGPHPVRQRGVKSSTTGYVMYDTAYTAQPEQPVEVQDRIYIKRRALPPSWPGHAYAAL